MQQDVLADLQTLWDFNRLDHEPRPVEVGIGLGSHDLGVASHTAQLYARGLFPRVVFTGANSPTTAGLYPRGEAVHFRERAVALGVPAAAIMLETRARHTVDNLTLTRQLLRGKGIEPGSAMLISRPCQQRRCYAICRKHWPELDVVCTSQQLSLPDYLDAVGDEHRVITMAVGDTVRLTTYAEKGWAIPQHIPHEVARACDRLIVAGYTGRL